MKILYTIRDWLLDTTNAEKVHICMAAFFVLNIPFAVTILANSVPYLVGLSVWALIAAHWAAFQGVHSEKVQQEDNDVDFDDLDKRVEELDKKLDRLLYLLEHREALPEECL